MTILLKHRACTRLAQGVHGACMGCVQRFTGCAWIMNGLCMGYASDMHKVFTECARGVHGACTGHAWDGACTGPACPAHGACMGPAKGVHGSKQSVHRAFMGHAW